jgi:hypothetical protein
MQKKLGFGTVLALAFAVAVIMVTPAASSGSGSGDDDHVQVIRVHAVTVQEAGVDLGETGDSLGDEFIFSDDLFKHGKKVGIDGGVCTLVRLEPMVSATLQCIATAELPKGQITAQALLTFMGENEQPESNVWAITGGTGKYKEAGGVLKAVDISETESLLILKITN